MRGYERDEYEDLDEYEEDGEEDEYEEDGGEDGYEETHEPTQDEVEYLGLREKLKESIRKQMKKELGTANSGSRDKRNGFRKDNYGSFFGPSQPVIAQRVIQESKSLLENPNLAARISKPSHANNKSSGSAPAKAKAQTNYRPKPTNVLRKNVEMRKNTRDYSFLLSEDAEIPSSTRSPPRRNISGPPSDARSKQVVNDRGRLVANGQNRGREVVNGHDRGREINSHDRGRETNGHDRGREANGHDRGREANGRDRGREVANGRDRGREVANGRDRGREVANGRDRGREVANGHDRGREVANGRDRGREVANGHDRGREATNGHDRRKQMLASSQGRSKSVGQPSRLPIESGRQLGSNNGSGPGRPLASKGSLPSKSPTSAIGKVTPGTAKSSMARPTPSQTQSGARKPIPSQVQPGVHRPTSTHGKAPVQRRDYQETSRPKIMSKQPLSSSRDQLNRPPPKPAARGALTDQRPKAKPKRPFPDEDSDDDNAISMIRQMFGYNPNKFRDDDDVSDMEAGFDDIMREEKRSAKIARKEDEEQLRLIEEEERRERMRMAKKRKMGH